MTPPLEPRRYPNGQPDLHDPAWHEEDGHGGCTTCLFSVPYTDDEQIRQNWPCAVVREAEADGAPDLAWIERRHAKPVVAGEPEDMPAPAPLDVKALAEAFDAHEGPARASDAVAHDRGHHGTECMAQVAAAYTRLTARAAVTEDEEGFFPFTHDHP